MNTSKSIAQRLPPRDIVSRERFGQRLVADQIRLLRARRSQLAGLRDAGNKTRVREVVSLAVGFELKRLALRVSHTV